MSGCADRPSQTSLHDAARSGDVETVRLLLDRGADIEAKHGNGWTPLHWAAVWGYIETVRLLLDRGADIEAKVGADGPTPLHWAAGSGKVETVRLLLDRGADINAEDNRGETPLDVAIEKNLDESHDEIIALLRRAGEK